MGNPFRRAGGVRPFMDQRGQGGDNFIDRLIRDANRQDAQGGQGGNAGLPSNVLRPQPNLPNQQNAENLAEPSEENINLLMEMGFSRERVVQALIETNNDVQLATVILLQQ